MSTSRSSRASSGGSRRSRAPPVSACSSAMPSPRTRRGCTRSTPRTPRSRAWRAPEMPRPAGSGWQFRYAFATDKKGRHTIDITDPAKPRLAATVPLAHAKNVYIARTYAYVANGEDGLAIVDIERPEKPFLDQEFKEELKDVHDV